MNFYIKRVSVRNAFKVIAVLIAGIGAWLLTPTSAHPCPPPDCERVGYFGVDDGAEIPPNTEGIPWAPDSSDDGDFPHPQDEHVRLLRDPDGDAAEVDARVERLDEFPWLVVPDEGFESDESYELQAACPRYDAEEGAFQTVRWTTADAPADPPEQLGSLRVDAEELTDATVAASPDCSVEAPLYVVDLAVEFADGAVPWEGVLQFETRVTDGGDTQKWRPSTTLAREHAPGASWMGRGVDRLYTHCGDYEGVVDGLDPGSYEVRFSAAIPGEDDSLESDSVEVTLDCPGTDDADDEETSTGRDTGIIEDTDGDDSSHDQPAENGGCTCATGATPASILALFALVVLGRLRRPLKTSRTP